jgi:hypothetical protein
MTPRPCDQSRIFGERAAQPPAANVELRTLAD